jgi:hypothetical protein
MTIVTGITSQPKQSLFLVLEDGSQVSCYVEYRSQQIGWFANLSWQTWELKGLRLTASPNLLQPWSALLPFGLGILTRENAEPLNLSDFADGTAVAYLLNAADVAEVAALTYAGN